MNDKLINILNDDKKILGTFAYYDHWVNNLDTSSLKPNNPNLIKVTVFETMNTIPNVIIKLWEQFY